MKLKSKHYVYDSRSRVDTADVAIRAALEAGKVMMFATSQPESWKAHFTKRFPDAKIEMVNGGLRIWK